MYFKIFERQRKLKKNKDFSKRVPFKSYSSMENTGTKFIINDYPLSWRVGLLTAILSSLNAKIIVLSHIYGLIQQRKFFQDA